MSRLRWVTAGESHGPRLTAFVEGVPAGLPLLAEDVDVHLARRQQGYGRGGTDEDRDRSRRVRRGACAGGETLGSPIAMLIANRDYANWLDRMSPAPMVTPPEPLTRPRPGHADLAGGLKLDRHDLRDVLERASARETASRTAVGAVCRKLLGAVGIDVFAHVVAIGGVEAKVEGDMADVRSRARASDLACADPVAEPMMKAAIRDTAHAGDTLGGVFEVVATGVMPGLGSHVQWDRKLDGRLAQALMSIQAMKGVEIGAGFGAARTRGSEVHDPIHYDGVARRFFRPTNRAGGLEGGVTNGEPVVCRVAMKPIATLKKALASVDVRTKEAYEAAFERSDVCAVAAASVVGEAMVCIVLADALLEKFGGDSMRELVRNVEGYRSQLADY
jgi:chorismate synthase